VSELCFATYHLVHFESFSNPKSAIAREKQIKGWGRAKKVALIESLNPTWEDLAEKYFAQYPRKADPSPAKSAGSG